MKNDLYPIGLVRQQMRRRGNTGREMVSAPSLFMLPDANKNKLFANKYLCSRQNNMKYVPHTSPYMVFGSRPKKYSATNPICRNWRLGTTYLLHGV